MSTTKFEHVIGRDGLHRIRKTCVENGEIIGNTHEGMSSRHKVEQNEILVLKASLAAANIPWPVADGIASCYAESFRDIPTVDERDSEPVPAEPAADPLRHERVFGKPADPFEPQTPGPVEPQLR